MAPNQALVPVKFQYASESDRGPYPFSASTQIEGGSTAPGDRHAIMVNAQSCTLYELYHAYYHSGGKSTAGSGAIWKFAQGVGPAHLGEVTHQGLAGERRAYPDL